jgi:FMN phosphatase YigB (HAD superfamily)
MGDAKKIRLVAFDLFGTVFDMSSTPKQEVRDYIAHVRRPEWSPLVLPESWKRLPRFADAHDGIKEIVGMGMLAVTCSNAPLAFTKDACFGLPFSGYTNIAANRCYKPHPNAYLAICQQFKVEPAEVLMVTGNAGSPDIEGARAVGMQSRMIRQLGSPQTISNLAYELELLNA